MKTNLSAGEKSKLYFPQLDSIRGMSFIAIFFFHSLRINYGNNFLGSFIKYLFNSLPLAIDVFFILSSFLLTYLALHEHVKTGKFSFGNYFRRRILRIWPLYYLILILAFLIFPFVAHFFHAKMTLPNPLYYIFFIANFYTIEHVFFLQFLWTISVEEQFYLLWGLSMRFFYKYLRLIIAVLFIVSVSFSVYAICNRVPHYFNTLTYLFDFGCGGLGAIMIFNNWKVVRCISHFQTGATVGFYCYLPFHFFIFYFADKYLTGTAANLTVLLSRYLFIVYIALLIVEQMKNERRTKALEKNQFLIYTGKISYGLYCFHGITITFTNLLLQHFNIDMQNWLLVFIYFIINYLIASASYFYFELPFLKLKAKWRST